MLTCRPPRVSRVLVARALVGCVPTMVDQRHTQLLLPVPAEWLQCCPYKLDYGVSFSFIACKVCHRHRAVPVRDRVQRNHTPVRTGDGCQRHVDPPCACWRVQEHFLHALRRGRGV